MLLQNGKLYTNCAIVPGDTRAKCPTTLSNKIAHFLVECDEMSKKLASCIIIKLNKPNHFYCRLLHFHQKWQALSSLLFPSKSDNDIIFCLIIFILIQGKVYPAGTCIYGIKEQYYLSCEIILQSYSLYSWRHDQPALVCNQKRSDYGQSVLGTGWRGETFSTFLTSHTPFSFTQINWDYCLCTVTTSSCARGSDQCDAIIGE